MTEAGGFADRLLAAALTLRLGVDATGVQAEVASKLTGAERQAELTANRISAANGRIAESGAVSSQKLEASILRQTAAQETYNRLLRAGETDTVRLARAQASLITAQRTVATEQARITRAAEVGAVGAGAAGRTAAAGGLFGGARGLIGAAAGLGAFTALRSGIRTYEDLTSRVRQFQRATQDSAEESSRFIALFDRFNISSEAGTTALVRFGRIIDQTPEKLRQYGVEIARNDDGTVNVTKTFLNAGDALQKIPDGAARSALTLDLFGRSGARLLPILTQNKEQLAGFLDETERSGLIFNQAQVDKARELATAQANLSEAWKGFELVLARGVTPALKDFDRAAAGALHFLEDHRTLANIILRVGELTGAVLLLSKAWRFVETTAKAAFGAEVLAGAGAAGGIGRGPGGGAGGTGLPLVIPAGGTAAAAATVATEGRLARLGTGLRSGFNSPLSRALILPYAGYEAYHLETRLLNRFGLPGISPPKKINPIGDLGPATMQLLQPYIDKYGGDVNAAMDAFIADNQQRQAAAAVVRQATSQAGRSYFASLTPFNAPPKSDRVALTGAVSSAQARVNQAQRGVSEAEDRLALARRSDMTTALDLRKAEDALATAKERSSKASRDLAAAEEKRRKGLAPTALTPQQLQHRLDATVATQKSELESIGVLHGEGLSNAAIQRLVQVDQASPGTLKYAADHVSQQWVNEMNRSFRELKKLSDPIGEFLQGDKASIRKAGADAAEEYALGFNNRLSHEHRRSVNRERRLHALGGGPAEATLG